VIGEPDVARGSLIVEVIVVGPAVVSVGVFQHRLGRPFENGVGQVHQALEGADVRRRAQRLQARPVGRGLIALRFGAALEQIPGRVPGEELRQERLVDAVLRDVKTVKGPVDREGGAVRAGRGQPHRSQPVVADAFVQKRPVVPRNLQVQGRNAVEFLLRIDLVEMSNCILGFASNITVVTHDDLPRRRTAAFVTVSLPEWKTIG
jgi:hypothetical protein